MDKDGAHVVKVIEYQAIDPDKGRDDGGTIAKGNQREKQRRRSVGLARVRGYDPETL